MAEFRSSRAATGHRCRDDLDVAAQDVAAAPLPSRPSRTMTTRDHRAVAPCVELRDPPAGLVASTDADPG
jgi:hypothetical protein